MTYKEYTILLVRSVILEDRPPEKPEEVRFEDVYAFAKRQKIENLCFDAIKQLDKKPDEVLLNRWSQACSTNIAQSIVQEHEKERLAEAFVKENISYLPVKGWYLRGMYPKSEYRFMSDIDILIHGSDRKKAGKVMNALGYTYEFRDYGYEDSYTKKPYMHVELHRDLVVQRVNKWYSYYQSIWRKAKIKSGNEYCLPWNDFYIFMIINYAKDFTLKGSGIRSALDLFVFFKTHGKDLDRGYIDQELRNLDVKELEEDLIRTSKKWFEEGDVSYWDRTSKLLIRGGVYGSKEDSVKRYLHFMLKGKNYGTIDLVKLALHRAFPGFRRMKYKYPMLEKAPILLPIFWIFRWCRHSGRLTRELRELWKLRNK